MKTCNKCNQIKPLVEFYKAKTNTSDGRRGDCKSCKDSTIAIWRGANKDRVKATARASNKTNRLRNRLYRYKLTPDQYHQMLVDQNSLCKICSTHTNDKVLVVDHCHKTGKVRGLLCRKCDTLISLLDNPDLFSKALSYIKS